jgi:acyl-CoA synthetase (AMP-forming)/AMP-acid ligase II
MTTLPAGEVARKSNSVGRALPGGRLAVMAEDGSETSAAVGSGEVVYYGANVMMGYAETAADLARGDDQGGRLETGDLGRLDDDGDLYLEGRIKRIGKAFGLRLNLDDIEQMVPGPAAAVSGDDNIVVWIEGPDGTSGGVTARELASRLRVHPSGIIIRQTAELPRLANGKVDYRALES